MRRWGFFLTAWGLIGFPGATFGASGGPDVFGATWVDSDEAGGPVAGWATAATEVPLSDDGEELVEFGFDYWFYGQTYSNGYLAANGGLLLGTTSTSLSIGNACSPPTGAVLVAPLWDDLDPSDAVPDATPTVLVDTIGPPGDQVFVASWVDVPRYGVTQAAGSGATFQLRLYEADGAVEFHYVDVDFGASSYDGGLSASVMVGVLGSAAVVGCNEAVLSDDYAVRFEFPTECEDLDGDGYSNCDLDCGPLDPLIHPAQVEVCGDGTDSDCDGVDPPADEDGDGKLSIACGGDDCDDQDPGVSPSSAEICDGVDTNCDGQLSATEEDLDGDGQFGCEGDCAQLDPDVYEGAPELCDGLDNDCDGVVPADELDNDGDGFRGCGGDCDDDQQAVHPDQPELCDGLDTNCDGVVPPDDADGDGDGVFACAGDCDDADPSVHPGLDEVCGDDVDQDCDGSDIPCEEPTPPLSAPSDPSDGWVGPGFPDEPAAPPTASSACSVGGGGWAPALLVCLLRRKRR